MISGDNYDDGINCLTRKRSNPPLPSFSWKWCAASHSIRYQCVYRLFNHIPDGVIHFSGAVYDRGFGVRETYDVHTVFLGVDNTGHHTSYAIVNDDLIVRAARYEAVTIGWKVETVDLFRVLPEHLGHLQVAHYVVDKLHHNYCVFAHDRGECWEPGKVVERRMSGVCETAAVARDPKKTTSDDCIKLVYLCIRQYKAKNIVTRATSITPVYLRPKITIFNIYDLKTRWLCLELPTFHLKNASTWVQL